MSPADRTTPTAEDETRAVAAAYAAGAQANPVIRLPPVEFRTHLDGMAERQARALDVAARACLLLLARRQASEDLFLAASCERTLAGAWERFAERFLPWLRGLLERRGARGSDVEELVGETPGLLVVPPRSGNARTTLGTWDGRARLSSWLASITLRRWAGRRQALPRSADTLVDPQDRRRPGAVEPFEEVLGAEAARNLAAALEAGWETLTERERLALLLRYRGGVPQKRIAVLLGVGEPRVSRLLTAAVERLRAAVEPVVAGAEVATPGAAAALARWLATREGVDTPRDMAQAPPETPVDA